MEKLHDTAAIFLAERVRLLYEFSRMVALFFSCLRGTAHADQKEGSAMKRFAFVLLITALACSFCWLKKPCKGEPLAQSR